MKLPDFLRRRSPEPEGKTLTTTIVMDDPDRPTECECGKPAVFWVEYLWRRIEKLEFVSGHTVEDVCSERLTNLGNDTDVQILESGML